MAQRTAIYGARDAARETRDAKMSEMKDLKSQTKYKSAAEIDRKIKALETAQSTTSMTLAKEKETLKEIAELKKQRVVVAQTESVALELDGGKAADNGVAIKDLNEQLAAIKAEMDKHSEFLNKLAEKSKDSAFPALMKEKDALKAVKAEKLAAMQKLWDDFKEDNKVWKENQAAWDQYKKVRAAAVGKEYEARKAEKAAARAAELAKKTPYEEEMALCDYLVNYLSTTFLGNGEKAAKEAPAAAAQLTGEFAGMTLNKGNKGGDEDYMAATGKKGPKKGNNKKAVAGTKRGKIVIFPETLESFGLLKMEPPLTVEAVAATVAALTAKKAAFASMPRGAVVSIAELNMKFEEEAEARPRPRYDDDSKKPEKFVAKEAVAKAAPKVVNPSKKLDVASTELFPSLGGPKKAVAAAAEEEKK
jgi:uncharacterized coiled-coil DUF342 family protein